MLSRSLLGWIAMTGSAPKVRTEAKLLARMDARANNIKAKINTRADKLANLTLIIQKGHDQQVQDNIGRQQRSGTGEIGDCPYCSKPGHGAI